MADNQTDFPALESESGITESEREEIRAHIEKVGTENRIPVEAAQFSLGAARRGVLLPFVVNAAAIAAIALAALLLSVVFRREEHGVQNQAAQYASVEGKLIRELRQESRQQLDSKEKEIEEVRAKLKDLEQQQQALEATYAEKLRQKEQELRQRLKEEVDAERARLVSGGIQSAEVERRMRAFEAERKAFYDRQLEEYRRKLQAERAQLQADITRLRSEYSSRLRQLEQERSRLVADYEKREAALRVQLEQRTQVVDRLRSQSAVDIQAAQRELAQLGRQQEQVTSVENQIEGQVARIRDSLGKGDAANALSHVRDLQGYLQQESVRSIPQLSDRVRTDLFLLDQLGTFLDERVRSEAAGGRSLTADLVLLGQVRRLFQEASQSRDDAARIESYKQLIGTIPEVQSASTVLVEAAVTQAVQDFTKRSRQETEADTQAAVGLMAGGDYAGALERYKAAMDASPALSPDSPRIISDLLQLGYSMSRYTRTGTKGPATDLLASQAGVDLEADRQAFQKEIQRALAAQRQELGTEVSSSRAAADTAMADALAAQKAELQKQIAQAEAQHEKEMDALATEAGTTPQQLARRLTELLAFEKEVNAARAAYAAYDAREKSARQANPSDPLTASRQELNRFLRDNAVTSLFTDISDRVNAIYTATQNAGASAALADAATIMTDVARQPTLKASRQLLQFEMKNAADNDRLKAILSAVDGVLARAQP